MKQNLLALGLCAALLVGTAPAQAAAQSADNVDHLTWQQASAYYERLSHISAGRFPGDYDLNTMAPTADPPSVYDPTISIRAPYAAILDFNGDGILDLFCVSHSNEWGSRISAETVVASLWTYQDGKLCSLPFCIQQLDGSESWTDAAYSIISDGGSGLYTVAVYLHRAGDGYKLIQYETARELNESGTEYTGNYTPVPSGPPAPGDVALYDQRTPGDGVTANDVSGLLVRLRQRALQTGLSYEQTQAYWYVMEEISGRSGAGYTYVENIYRKEMDDHKAVVKTRLYDADGDGTIELEVIGDTGQYPIQYWRELWDYDGTSAYLSLREAPYSYVIPSNAADGHNYSLFSGTRRVAFELTRDQLNRHWTTPIQVKIDLNGQTTFLPGCLSGNSNYVRLRDIATLLNGTAKEFDVDYQDNVVVIVPNTPYTPTGTERQAIPLASGQMCPKVYFCYLTMTPESFEDLKRDSWWFGFSQKGYADAFVFGGNNFIKLRDIARVLDFYVGWDGATNTVVIDPARGYAD